MPEGEYVAFEHGPFDYEQECRTVEDKVEAAMRSFDYAAHGCTLDTATPGRVTYFYFVPGQYFKYTPSAAEPCARGPKITPCAAAGFVLQYPAYAGVVEWVDSMDLGSIANGVRVRVPPPAPLFREVSL